MTRSVPMTRVRAMLICTYPSAYSRTRVRGSQASAGAGRCQRGRETAGSGRAEESAAGSPATKDARLPKKGSGSAEKPMTGSMTPDDPWERARGSHPGLPDEQILAKVLEAATALPEGLT
jgi:hypothetical protein